MRYASLLGKMAKLTNREDNIEDLDSKRDEMIKQMIKTAKLTAEVLELEGKNVNKALIVGAVAGMTYDILRNDK